MRIDEDQIREAYGVIPASSVTERVAAGVRFLDERVPGWRERVKVEEFDIQSPCNCVLGQVFADMADPADVRREDGFTVAVPPFANEDDFPDDAPFVLTGMAAGALGFDYAFRGDARLGWGELQDAWLEVLQ